MPLSDITIRNAKPKEKQYKISDKDGLYLLVKPSGSKLFRLDYRFCGKRKTASFGQYPRVKLKDARKKCIDAHRLIDDGIDPMVHKKNMERHQVEAESNTLEAVALEWFAKNHHTWVPEHGKRILRRLEKDVFPWLGQTPIHDVTASDLLLSLRRIEERGAHETAHRVKTTVGQVMRYAIATGRAERDISADLKGALVPTKSKNMSAITEPGKVGELLRAIDGYSGQFTTKCALKLAPLVFLRPRELRHLEWEEINFDAYEIKIPAEKMKMRRPHIVPLSFQAADVLREIEPLTGDGQYVFPSVRTSSRPMSENTVLAALRRMGFLKEEMCGHGFRAMASTLLHENGWQSHLIELQLAHTERNSVKAAYNHAEHMDERRKMMSWWADHLDELKGAV